MSKPRSAQPRARAQTEDRRTVWTADRVARVCERHAAGVFLKHACALEGGTYDGIIDAAATRPEVRAAINKAHAEGVERLREMLDLAADWKRAAWELERFDREAYAPPKQTVEGKQEITGKDGAPLLPSPAEAKAELAKRIAAMTPAQRAAWDALTSEDET